MPANIIAPASDAAQRLAQAIVDNIKTCYDPEIPVDIYELGLIYDIEIAEDGKVKVNMTLTSPSCPSAGTLPPEVQHKVAAVPGVTDVELNLVWEPTWGVERMSEEARLELGML